MPWLDFTASPICQQNCMCSHSLTQFCQNNLVNLNAFNSKVFFKPNHFDRAGLGHCSCYSSTKSNLNFRGSLPSPSQYASCTFPIILLRSHLFLHCSLLSLQLCCLQGNTVRQLSEMWVFKKLQQTPVSKSLFLQVYNPDHCIDLVYSMAAQAVASAQLKSP